MTNAHHGMPEKRGIKNMTRHEGPAQNKPGRFGRMFSELAPLYTNPNDLKDLGRKEVESVKGPMNGGDKHKLTQCVPLGFIFLGQFIDHERVNPV